MADSQAIDIVSIDHTIHKLGHSLLSALGSILTLQKAGFLQMMASFIDILPVAESSSHIMTVFKLRAGEEVAREEAGTLPICWKLSQKPQNRLPLRSYWQIWVTWIPVAARESGKTSYRAVIGLDVS